MERYRVKIFSCTDEAVSHSSAVSQLNQELEAWLSENEGKIFYDNDDIEWRTVGAGAGAGSSHTKNVNVVFAITVVIKYQLLNEEEH